MLSNLSKLRTVLAAGLLLAATFGFGEAKATILTESCSYVMGDNDTKNDARQLCYLQAKRKLLEKAGTYVQSNVSVQQGRLTKDQIATYSAAILSVEVTKERTTMKGQHMVMELEVRANINLDDVRKRLSQIAAFV